MSSAWVDLDRLADGVTDAILKYIERQGYAIVPAASVVSAEDRAAVGRLATYCNRTLQLALDNLRSTPMSDPTWMRKSKDLEIIESAFDTGDIEAAQRVADGGA